MRCRLLIGLALCSSAVAIGQTTNPPATSRLISLPECIDMALMRNLDLQIVRQSPEIARFNLGSAWGAYDPTLSFEAGRNEISRPSDFDAKKVNDYLPYNERFDHLGPELSGRLPEGLSYDFNLLAEQKRARTDLQANPGAAAAYPGGIRDTNNYDATASLELRQHLLKDFWIDPYREKLLFRKKDLKISQEALRLQIMKTVLAVQLKYYDLQAAREKIAVVEKSLELKRQFVAETKRRVEVGDLPQLDGEQAESQLQTTLTVLSAARENLMVQQNMLASLVADDFKTWVDLDLKPTEALAAVKEEPNRSASFQNALRNRPDLVAARLAMEKSDVAIRFQKNQLFPSLDVTGSYGGYGVEGGSTSAVGEAMNLHNHEYSYGVVVSVPLGNVTARNDYKASKAARRVAELELQKAEQEVLLQIAMACTRLQSRFSQTDSTRQARVYAERALNAEQKKLQNGLSTSFIVLQLQEALASARNAEVDAMVDYNKIVAEFAFAEATILDRLHLAVEVK